MKKIDIVSFDVGGTLLVPHPSVGAVYAEVLSGFGIESDPELLESAFRRAFRSNRREGRLTDKDFWRRIVYDVFSPFLSTQDLPEAFERAFATFAEGRRWKLVNGVTEAMAWVRQIGAVPILFSNNDERLLQTAGETGLSQWVDHIFYSEALGFEKPATEAFEAVQKGLGLSDPGAILHIGDDREADAEGSARAGWRGVWINPDMNATDDSNLCYPKGGAWKSVPSLAALTKLS